MEIGTATTTQKLCLNGACITNLPYSISAASSTAGISFDSTFLNGLLAAIAQWLGSATNGLHDIYATVFHAQEVDATNINTTQLCVGTTCVTQSQFLAMVNAASQQAGSGSNSGNASSTPDTIAPVITLSGANPATITVSSTYIDPGATVTDNVDTNLDIHVSIDGGATTTPDQISIDTSLAGTHSILFASTDQAGNTGYATRVVVVASSTTP